MRVENGETPCRIFAPILFWSPHVYEKYETAKLGNIENPRSDAL